MIKAIIFDFDGVILESADIKTRAFGKLFERDYPEKADAIVEYHIKNAGISRYIKFRHIYSEILGLQLSAEKEHWLGEEFSRIVLEDVLSAPFVPGIYEFIRDNSKRYQFFIASGTPEEELGHIVESRKLTGFFREIGGTPRTKPEIIRGILQKYLFLEEEVVFIGDAESDMKAASETGLKFIARVSGDNIELEKCEHRVKDFTELNKLLNGF